ncbi:hypothetical protein ACLB1N_20925 [Escherichia coli]
MDEKEKGRGRLDNKNSKDKSPLRWFYIKGNDKAIEQILKLLLAMKKIILG